jgi:PPOX class probable FMN-dependent enzyme
MTKTEDGAPFTNVVTSNEQLRTLYRSPVPLVAEKKMDHIPGWIRVAIEASRFVFVATANRAGHTTVSPKGGRDGFVVVLDEHRLAIPDYPGNNLIDGLRNIVENPSVGLIFLIPGRNDTIRVDGEAWVTTDPEVLERCIRDDGRTPKAAVGVRVRHTFFHCPSSFQRAGLWDQAGWRPDATHDFDDFVRASLPRAEWPDWA